MKTHLSFLAVLAATAAVTCAHAQNASANGANAGMQIANSGAGNGVAACASCHGAKGEGNAAANFPRIAGQSQTYLAHQLANFANGSRNNPVMTPIAKGLTQQQIDAVSAYYAALEAPSAKTAAPAAAQQKQEQKRGQQLATVGDNKIGVQSCANCHGPGGSGEPPTYPYLAGQHASYLKAALQEWKKGTRNTDPTQQMQTIAKRLSDDDINAVAAYFAAQPVGLSAGQRFSMPKGSAARPAAAGTGQRGGSTPVQGVGSGQGAATNGGGQGPGGGGSASGSGPSGSPTGNAR